MGTGTTGRAGRRAGRKRVRAAGFDRCDRRIPADTVADPDDDHSCRLFHLGHARDLSGPRAEMAAVRLRAPRGPGPGGSGQFLRRERHVHRGSSEARLHGESRLFLTRCRAGPAEFCPAGGDGSRNRAGRRGVAQGARSGHRGGAGPGTAADRAGPVLPDQSHWRRTHRLREPHRVSGRRGRCAHRHRRQFAAAAACGAAGRHGHGAARRAGASSRM